MHTISVRPQIRYPRKTQVGATCVMTVDLEHSIAPEDWPYAEEEYPIHCFLDTGPLFEHEPIGNRAAVDASLLAWSRGKEPSEMHRATIEACVMHGDIDAVIAPALVALFAQIEEGGRPARTAPPVTSIDRLDRLQRRILEIWADDMRQACTLCETVGGVRAGQNTADALIRASEGRVLTTDLDTLEALAIGEGPRGRALRRALEVCGGQAVRTS